MLYSIQQEFRWRTKKERDISDWHSTAEEKPPQKRGFSAILFYIARHCHLAAGSSISLTNNLDNPTLGYCMSMFTCLHTEFSF